MTTPDPANPTEDEHRDKMAEVKAEMKTRTEAAQERRGILIVNTGNGKGKSTAGFGVVTRTLAYGRKAVVVQFIKATPDTAEKVLRCDNLTWHAVGGGFTWDTQDRAGDIALCEKGWALAEAAMADPEVSLVMLDEMNIVLSMNYLETDRVVSALVARRPELHVIVTGRDAPEALCAAADLVSEMKEIKHPFNEGIMAQRGIEY
ncbi:MAG: cob(I)yrinic acid a,c-diamide adenosyltransferase [Opitutaceae bacterium]|jgi:cob(I)alamin adenosyltransferase|nr:cob(I)yrinic acid a,c-diamide adenosyltransferase [Opitutaceae bacterium]